MMAVKKSKKKAVVKRRKPAVKPKPVEPKPTHGDPPRRRTFWDWVFGT